MPTFSDDDVIDFMVKEALVARSIEDRKDAESRAERKRWRDEHRTFDPSNVRNAMTPKGG